jgi:perosamine synthetase
MRIPLSGPDITQAEIDAVAAVMRSGRLSLGPKLEEFEAALANYVGARYAVAVSSGTAGLHLMVRALGMGEGNEVIMPSFTFIAVANAVRYERAAPVFADIDPATLNLDPAAVEATITPRTRAILVVHTFGVPADLEKLTVIAEKHGLILFEDACEALGAEWRGKKAGAFGQAGVFGFYPNKQITTAEGGAVVTNDEKLAARLRSLRNQGRTPTGEWFEHHEIGYNYRLSELHAAMGIEQLKRIDAILTRRMEIARSYNEQLRACGQILLPFSELADGRISWFVYAIRLAKEFSCAQRDAVVQAMRKRGIACGRYFAPVHLQRPYKVEGCGLPVTESVAERTIALPFFNALSEDQIDEVCSALRECIECTNGSKKAMKSAISL